jgi:hypothetical protein
MRPNPRPARGRDARDGPACRWQPAHGSRSSGRLARLGQLPTRLRNHFSTGSLLGERKCPAVPCLLAPLHRTGWLAHRRGLPQRLVRCEWPEQPPQDAKDERRRFIFIQEFIQGSARAGPAAESTRISVVWRRGRYFASCRQRMWPRWSDLMSRMREGGGGDLRGPYNYTSSF